MLNILFGNIVFITIYCRFSLIEGVMPVIECYPTLFRPLFYSGGKPFVEVFGVKHI